MKNYIVLILLLLIFNKYCFESLEIIIPVDINSNIIYENYECGTSINIIEKGNKYILEDKYYPPCKSLEDAGIRFRQIPYLYEYMSLIIEFINFDWKNSILDKNINIGNYNLNFCSFQIRVKDEPNATIVIDGSNSDKNFILFKITKEDLILCNDTQTFLNNIKFQNWSSPIFTLNVSSQENFNLKFNFNSIITENITSRFIENIWLTKKNIKINYNINNCHFLNSNPKLVFIQTQGSLLINNCTFNNFQPDSCLVQIDNGEGEILNSKFYKINSKGYSLLFSSDANINLINFTIEKCSFINLLSTQYYNFQISIFFKNIYFNENILLNGDGIFIFLNHYDENKDTIYYFDNIVFKKNQIKSKKDFIQSYYKTSIINISNIYIPNNFYSTINLNDSKIYLNGNLDFINSKSFSIGNNNIININKTKNELTENNINYLNNYCNDCIINYIKDDSILSSSSNTQLIFNNTINNNNNNTIINNGTKNDNKLNNLNNTNNTIYNNNNKKKNKFKVLIPIIIIGSVLLIVIVGSIILKNRIKFFFNNDNNNYIDRETDTGLFQNNSINKIPIVVGEVEIRELAHPENDAAKS